jgi:hypothetical protein
MPDNESDYEVGGEAAAAHLLQERPVRQPRRPPRQDPSRALLAAALDEPVYLTTNGRCRKLTKREAVVTQIMRRRTKASTRTAEWKC